MLVGGMAALSAWLSGMILLCAVHAQGAAAAMTGPRQPQSPQEEVRGLAPAAGVSGTVYRPDGTPAAGAKVTLWALREAWPSPERTEIESAFTGNDGAFRFRTAPGPCQHLSCEQPYFAGDDAAVRHGLRAHDLRLRTGWRVVGIVQAEGTRSLRDTVVALEPMVGEVQAPVEGAVDENGRFLVDNVPRGNWRLVARHPDLQPAVLTGVAVGSTPLLTLTMRGPALTLAGRVEAGQPPRPVGGARVRAWPQAAPNGLPATVLTDADGRFVLRGLARGPLRVEVQHEAHSTVSRVVAVDGTSPPIAVEMGPRSRVRGRLLPAVPGALATAGRLELVLRTRSGELHAATVQEDGVFEFAQPVSAGVASLAVHGGSCSFSRSGESSTTVRIEEGSDSDLQLEVVGSSVVRGRVLDGEGMPVAGVELYVRLGDQLTTRLRDAGSALLDRDLRRLGDQFTRTADADLEQLVGVTAEDGSFSIRGLPSGSLLVRTERPGLAAHRFRVTVPKAGEDVDLGDQVLPPPCVLTGRVVRGGRGLQGALLTATAIGSASTTVSAADGSFRFDDLAPGVYRIRARWTSMAAGSSGTVSVAPTKAAEGVLVEFPAGRTLLGTVRTTEGRPVEVATVLAVGETGASVTTDGEGRFALELPREECELRVFLSESAAEAKVRVALDQEQVDIRLAVEPTAVLRGTVRVLPSRRSPRGVLLRCEPFGRPSGRTDRWVDLDAGVMRSASLPAGPCRVEVWCEGFVPFVRDVELPAGEEFDLGELLLEPGASFACTVVDEEGKPVPECVVFVGRDGDQSFFIPVTRTDARGRAVVGGVSSASRTVVVAAPGHARLQLELSIPRDIVRRDPMVVQVQRGAVIEVIGAGAAGSLVVLLANGRVVATAEVGFDGTATFENQPPGEYQVQLLDDIGRAVRFEVLRGQRSTRVELR